MQTSRRDALRYTLTAAALAGLGGAAATVVSPKAYSDGLKSIYNVKDYGVDLTGAKTSDRAFQGIITAAAAEAAAGAATVEVYIPPGIVVLKSQIEVGAGVIVKGAGLAATTVTSSSPEGVFLLAGASDITIADLTVESTAAGTNSIGICGSYSGLQNRVSITNCRITGTTNNAARFAYAINNLVFSDNSVERCASGFALYAPEISSGLLSTQIIVTRNRFRKVGAVNIQLFGVGDKGEIATDELRKLRFKTSTIFGVEISGNDLRDFIQSEGAGPIPIEPTGVTNLRVADNIIEGPATRGISMGNNVNSIVTGNIIRNQSFYAFELNAGRQYSIVGNTVENCKTFAVDTHDPRLNELTDVVIENNSYTGSGQTAPVSQDAIFLRSASRVRVLGNVFLDWEYLRGAVRIGDGEDLICKDCAVQNNTFVISDPDTPLNTVQIRSAIRTTVVGNDVRVNRDLTVNDKQAVITAVQDPQSSDTLIDGNHITFTGAVDAAKIAAGIGNGYDSPGVCAGLTICRNKIVDGLYGLRLVTNSADLAVYENDTSTCAESDVIPGTALNAPRIK